MKNKTLNSKIIIHILYSVIILTFLVFFLYGFKYKNLILENCLVYSDSYIVSDYNVDVCEFDSFIYGYYCSNKTEKKLSSNTFNLISSNGKLISSNSNKNKIDPNLFYYADENFISSQFLINPQLIIKNRLSVLLFDEITDEPFHAKKNTEYNKFCIQNINKPVPVLFWYDLFLKIK